MTLCRHYVASSRVTNFPGLYIRNLNSQNVKYSKAVKDYIQYVQKHQTLPLSYTPFYSHPETLRTLCRHYVASSRVTSLPGLYIRNLNSQNVKDSKAVKDYMQYVQKHQTLPLSYTPFYSHPETLRTLCRHYVASSRVTSLPGLYIRNLNSQNVKYSKAVKDYMQYVQKHQTLPLSYTPFYSYPETTSKLRSVHKQIADIKVKYNVMSWLKTHIPVILIKLITLNYIEWIKQI